MRLSFVDEEKHPDRAPGADRPLRVTKTTKTTKTV